MAFAALISLANTIEQNLHHHLIPDKQQIEALLQEATFLQNFLENSLHKCDDKVERLESQIRDVAYRAADIVESHLVDELLSKSAIFAVENSTTFNQALEKVIEEIHSIKQEVMKIEDEIDMQDLQPRTSVDAVSSKPTLSGESTMVGLDDELDEIRTRLTTGSSKLQLLSILGMGGIGKTTMARNMYDDLSIKDHFYIRGWVTVSQEYNERKLILDILDSMKMLPDNMRNEEKSDKLKGLLHKTLSRTRYLIVLDDVWDKKAWDDVKRLFSNDNNGSRIILTTRLKEVADHANSCPPLHHVRFLNDCESWKLFRDKVFGHESCCPPELDEIGKKISQNCRGLPLSIVVIGGLLSKAIKTEHYWRKVLENLSSTISSNDEQCLKVLSLSYKRLPHHMKGCLLYMGIFPEDFNIRVAMLVKLWVAEGILQPVKSKSLEDVAYEYLLDLVDRNLVLAVERSWDGKIKICKVHDLLRDLCKREAESENFFHVINENFDRIPRGINVNRVSIHRDREILYFRCINLPISLVQSSLFVDGRLNLPVFASCSLLRVLHTGLEYRINLPDEIIRQVNLRYLSGRCNQRWPLESIYELRNLQTLILYIDASVQLPPEIWNMTELRHVQLFGNVNLSDPPSAEIDGEDSIIVLEYLHTLCCIRNFRCTKEVVRRIPNLKKLEISYTGKRVDWKYYCLNNLGQLRNLETLKCFFYGQPLQPGIFTFPLSLKKLTLRGCKLPWEDMMAVGSVPKLEVLKLKHHAFLGEEWKPTEGEFVQLKFLQLENIDLVYWIADSIHFPLLERLVIKELYCMKEIPSGIGEIETLKLIEVHDCTSSVVTSAKQIQEDQQEISGDDVFKVQIFK